MTQGRMAMAIRWNKSICGCVNQAGWRASYMVHTSPDEVLYILVYS